MQAPVRLRAHHLLCVQTFVGKGYTPEFIANQAAIVERLNKGAAITIVDGIDDICAVLHKAGSPECDSGNHCLKDSTKHRDSIALASINTALEIRMEIGTTISLSSDHYALIRKSFADGTLRNACVGCEWHGLCSDISANGFKNTHLQFTDEQKDV